LPAVATAVTPRHSWRARQSIRLAEKADDPPKKDAYCVPDPTVHNTEDETRGLVVLRNFPIGALDVVSFKKPDNNSLVKEFWYKDNGTDVCYSRPNAAEENKWKYAKLITKSSHYKQLGETLFGVSVKVSSLSAQMALVFACMADRLHGPAATLRILYVSLFFFKIIGMLGFGIHRAMKKIKVDPGDFVRQSTIGDYLERLAVTTFFNMFDVSSDLTDLPILTHIRKPAQPFAVFRSSEAIRAWIVGWLTQSQHEVESQSGKMSNLVLSILCDLPLVLLKLALGNGLSWSSSLLVAIFWSVLTLALNCYTCEVLRRHRNAYYTAFKAEIERLEGERTTLQRRIEESGGDAHELAALKKQDKELQTKLIIPWRNINLHFGEIIPAPYRLPDARQGQARRRPARAAGATQPAGSPAEQVSQPEGTQQGGRGNLAALEPAGTTAAAAGSAAEGAAGTGEAESAGALLAENAVGTSAVEGEAGTAAVSIGPPVAESVVVPLEAPLAAEGAAGISVAESAAMTETSPMNNMGPGQRWKRAMMAARMAAALNFQRRQREEELAIQHEEMEAFASCIDFDPQWLDETCMTTLAGPVDEPPGEVAPSREAEPAGRAGSGASSSTMAVPLLGN